MAPIKCQHIARHTHSRMPSTVAVHAFTSMPPVRRCLTGEATMRIIVFLHFGLTCRSYLHLRHLHSRPCHSCPPTRSQLSRTPQATHGTSRHQRPAPRIPSYIYSSPAEPPTALALLQRSIMQSVATRPPRTQAAGHACAPGAHARACSSYLFSLQDRSLSRQLPPHATSPAPCPVQAQAFWLPDLLAVRPRRVQVGVLSGAACVRCPARPLPQQLTRQGWPTQKQRRLR